VSTSTRAPSARRAAAAGLLVVCGLLFPGVAAAAASELRPDLRIGVPGSVQLQTSGNRRLLRFDSIIENVGDGPLKVNGKRTCPDCTRMTTKQWILRSDGTWRVRKTDAVQRYTNADHHQHWHVMGMERYEVFPLDGPFSNGEVIGRKYGYCFFDGVRRDSSLPNAAPSARYSFFDCGVPDSQVTRVGLSVGWGDIYPWNFEGQFVDVTTVPGGDYLLCLTADPANDFVETRNGNNQAWAKIRLTAPAQGQSGWSLTVGQMGRTKCRTQLPWMQPGPGSATTVVGPPLEQAALPNPGGGSRLSGSPALFSCSIGPAAARA
jgi:hypothetical protein